MVSSVYTRTGIRCAATRALRRLSLRLRPSSLVEPGVRCSARRELALAVQCASRQDSNYRDRSHSHQAARSPWAGGRAGFRARGTATLELERDALAEDCLAARQ